jgi:NAD(P)-dependent dehydrogenase (short-subunit alcohol dehydrogenase family)
MAVSGHDCYGLADRVCVVTGSAGGIGRAVALALAAEGAKVAILDRNEEGAVETLQLVEQAGGEGVALGCDVSDPASVEAAQAAVRARFGEADVLVNNAALIRPGALRDITLADWNALISVNLTGYLICAQTFGRPMLARGGGVLVHTSSIAAGIPIANAGGYSVVKAAVSMLSRTFALEWAPHGVRSNAVLPGLINTPMTKAVYDRPDLAARRAALVPSGRIGLPGDIANAVVFLASPLSEYVNGAELVVDGALSLTTLAHVPGSGAQPD